MYGGSGLNRGYVLPSTLGLHTSILMTPIILRKMFAPGNPAFDDIAVVALLATVNKG